MSVEENTEEVTFDSIIQDAINGEETAEDPENSEQPEVVAEAEENQASVEAETEPPVVEETPVSEGQEESALPEWAGDFDLADEDEAAAVEYFAGGERADWTKLRFDEMTPEQAQKLKKAQAARDRFVSQQQIVEDPETIRRRDIEKRLYDKAEAMLDGKPQPKPEPEPQAPVDVMAKARELLETGDTEAALEAMADSFKEVNERKLAEMQKNMLSQVDERLDEKLSETTEKSYWSSFDKYGMELRDNDPRFAQMLVNDAGGKNALLRILEMKTDPITGEEIYTGADPVGDVDRAYNYWLRQSQGGKRRVPRPATSAQPPVNSVSGETPEISENELKLSWDEFFHQPHVYKDFEALSKTR